MIDPFGIQMDNLSLNDIDIFEYFYKYIKPIKGYSLLNNLSWDSYILSHISQTSNTAIYIGNIYLIYNRISKQFTQSNITPEYIKYIIELIQRTNPKIKKILFILEIELGKYRHVNILTINLTNKTINIFEPWGKIGRFRNTMKYYNKIKLNIIKPLFKCFKSYKIVDLATTYNIIGPQDSRLCSKIKNINNIPMNSLIGSENYIDKNLFVKKIDDKYVYVTLFPENNPKLIKIDKNENFNNLCGFDIHDGICDIFCLYYSLLVILNPNKKEHEIQKYMVESDKIPLQIKIINFMQWILQWYNYQVLYFYKKNIKLSITNYSIKSNTFKKNDLLYKKDRLSNNDKNISDILSYKYCKSINISKIYDWLTAFLSNQNNIEVDYVHRMIQQDKRLKNKCLLFLSIKNIYDISN